MRINWLPREKTAILKLRRLGYSIPQLQAFTGRSRSLISKILKFNEAIGALKHTCLRTLPNQIRRLAAQNKRKTMNYWINRWMPFILNETDKPP